MAARSSVVRFFYDVQCPYAYQASRRIEATARAASGSVEWVPVLLGGIYDLSEAPQGKANSASAVMAPAKKEIVSRDTALQLARHSVSFKMNSRHPVKSLHVMRILAGAPKDLVPSLTHLFYRSYWVDDKDLSTDEVIKETLATEGFPLDLSVVTDEAKKTLRANTEEAVRLGAFGVPFFAVGSKVFWGADRLVMIERELGNTFASPLRLCPLRMRPTPARLKFYFDFSSPWSYIGATQVERLAAECGAHLTLVPVLTGAIFKQIGTPIVPFHAMAPAKAAYNSKDLVAWAEYWNVPFQFSTHFPMKTTTALRLFIVEPKVLHPIFNAAWASNRDISDDAVLESVLTDAGLDGAALLEKARGEGPKDELRRNVQEAVEGGLCGVPSYRVNDGPVIWGQDRYDVVQDLLCGWDGGGLYPMTEVPFVSSRL